LKAVDEIAKYGPLFEGFSYKIVVRHPLADDTEWLLANNMMPYECVHADLYWAHESAVIFVSVDCSSRDPFVAYHRHADGSARDTFSVATLQKPLTRDSLEKALDWLAGWISDNVSSFGRDETKCSHRIHEGDILSVE
jgi:hypothetical protein